MVDELAKVIPLQQPEENQAQLNKAEQKRAKNRECQRRWRANNHEHRLKLEAERRKKNHEHLLKYHKEWCKKNREHLLKYQSEWRGKNPTLTKNARDRNYKRYAASVKSIYKIIKASSVKRGMEILITQDDFISWYTQEPKKCYYCGLPQELSSVISATVKRKVTRLTIDRLNNAMPYSIGNIALACYWCNQIKGSILTEDEMKIVGELVVKPKWERYIKSL